jgi:hypothetical protein
MNIGRPVTLFLASFAWFVLLSHGDIISFEHSLGHGNAVLKPAAGVNSTGGGFFSISQVNDSDSALTNLK